LYKFMYLIRYTPAPLICIDYKLENNDTGLMS